MLTTTQPPKPKRRWCRFSLFELIIAMTVGTIGLGIGWVGWRNHQARMNRDRIEAAEEPIRRAVIEIEKSGGRVGTNHGVPQSFRRTFIVYAVDFQGSTVTDADLLNLKVLANLVSLNLSETKVTDAGLEHLKGLTNLQDLILVRTNVTDEGVNKLQQALPNCEIIR